MLATAREVIGDLSSRLLVTTIVAHYRAQQISQAAAAKACRMTPDNFLRACQTVDEEARRMLLEMEKSNEEFPVKEEPATVEASNQQPQ